MSYSFILSYAITFDRVVESKFAVKTDVRIPHYRDRTRGKLLVPCDENRCKKDITLHPLAANTANAVCPPANQAYKVPRNNLYTISLTALMPPR